MQIIRGFVLAIIACILAYPISIFYDAPVLFPLLCLVGLTSAIRGFQTTGYATMNRKLQLGLLTNIELAARLLGIVTMVVWALISPTVWSLAAGGIVNAFMLVALAHITINTHPHRLCWDRECVSELFGFGKWIFITSILTFIAQSGDRFLLPVLFEFKDLGFYSLAIGLVMIPVLIMKRLSSKVLFPAYAELHNREDPDKLNAMITRFAKISFPVYLFPITLLALGPWIISVMYDDRYQNAGTMTSILAVGGYFAILRASQAGILLAVGKSKLAMYIQLGKTVTYIVGGILLAEEWGLDGYCAGLAVSEAVSYCLQRLMVSKALGKRAVRLDRVLLILLFAAMAMTAWFYGRW
jgi:O-antigen/teichoic acid export membrane protein